MSSRLPSSECGSIYGSAAPDDCNNPNMRQTIPLTPLCRSPIYRMFVKVWPPIRRVMRSGFKNEAMVAAANACMANEGGVLAEMDYQNSSERRRAMPPPVWGGISSVRCVHATR